MKVPLNWLKEYVDVDVSVEKLADALSLSGSEVEKIHKSSGYKNVVVGKILEVKKHPNADRLKVCKVEIAQKKVAQIVCGAPNVAKAQKVPVALPGAELGEIIIKKTVIRGVESSGMICAEDELGISEDHEGIMVLAENIKPGTPFSDIVGGDTILDIDLTPNRSDCLSIIGIAREAAAALGKKVKGTNFKKPEACPSDRRVESSKKVEVIVKDKDLCPRYIAKVVEGVKVGPSPKWMKDRLSAAGVRPISNVVDVTNYVMLEWGQPLHAFSMEKLQMTNSKCQIVVRKAKAGEKIETLDGVERNLTTSDLVIADGRKPVAVAGVMGGANSEVDEKSKTIILEAAVFGRTSVRKTAQRLALRSEASNRFEKGIPLSLPEIAIERASQLLTELSAESRGNNTQNNAEKMLLTEAAEGRGSKDTRIVAEMNTDKSKINNQQSDIIRVGPNVDVLSENIYPKYVGMRLSRLEKVLGIKIPEEKSIAILRSLGFEAEKFDFKKEARSHLGKPYVLGAKYSTHGDMAFDCSYFTDYIYRLIGQSVGHTALGQYEIGQKVVGELKPGDIVFYQEKGLAKVTDHYYITGPDGGKKRVEVKPVKEVGHCGIYIGDGRIVHAHMLEYNYKKKKWVNLPKDRAKVEEDSVDVITKNPEYLGARRFIEDPYDWISIKVPWWRLDVSIEEDIFEEIGRIYGYNNFPGTLPSGELPIYSENKKLKLISDIKNILVGAGLTEVYNYSFVSAKVINESGELASKALKIANPISPEQEYMRTNLIGSLLLNARDNQDNFERISIFEIASIYLPVSKEPLPREIPTLGILIKSQKGARGDVFYQAKGIFELVIKKLNLDMADYKEETSGLGAGNGPDSVFEKGRVSVVSYNGDRIGVLGDISEKTKNSFGLKYDFVVLEINLEKILGDYGKARKYRAIPKYPTAARDISLIFDKKISADEIMNKIRGSRSSYLKDYEVLDIYDGDRLPADKKSVTIRLVFGSNEGTLNEETVAGELNSVTNLLKNSLGGAERF